MGVLSAGSGIRRTAVPADESKWWRGTDLVTQAFVPALDATYSVSGVNPTDGLYLTCLRFSRVGGSTMPRSRTPRAEILRQIPAARTRDSRQRKAGQRAVSAH